MKFSASRSLLHGHGALVAYGQRLADRGGLRGELVVAVGQPEAALAHETPVARLDLEHVEVAETAAPAVQAPARVGDPVEAVATPQVLGALCRALDELEHQDRALGQVVDDGSAHPDLGGGDRRVMLVLAVDREQARVLGRDAHDVRAPADIDLVVRVGEPAGSVGDAALGARERGNQIEDLVDRARSSRASLRSAGKRRAASALVEAVGDQVGGREARRRRPPCAARRRACRRRARRARRRSRPRRPRRGRPRRAQRAHARRRAAASARR